MLSCSIWFSAPSFWVGGGLQSLCLCRVYGADGAVRQVFTTYLHLVTNLRVSGDVTLYIHGVNSKKLASLISLIPELPTGK